MDYKTYSFTYHKSTIKKILISNGYTIKSLAKTLDLIPSLKDKKHKIFKEEEIGKYSNALYNVEFAWKDKYELKELSLAIEHMANTWKKLPWRYSSGEFYRSYVFRYPNVRKFMIEKVLEELITKEVNKIINK